MPIPVQGEPRPREISQLEKDFKKVAGRFDENELNNLTGEKRAIDVLISQCKRSNAEAALSMIIEYKQRKDKIDARIAEIEKEMP